MTVGDARDFVEHCDYHLQDQQIYADLITAQLESS